MHMRRRTIGQRIRRRRAQLRMTQLELSIAIGTDKSTVYRYEQDRAQPRLDMLPRLGAALGCPVEWLVTGALALSNLSRDLAVANREIRLLRNAVEHCRRTNPQPPIDPVYRLSTCILPRCDG